MHSKKPSVLQFIWKYIKPYKKYYFLKFILPISYSLYSLNANNSLRSIINVVESHEASNRSILKYVLYVIFFDILLNIAKYLFNMAEKKSTPYVNTMIIVDCYKKVQNYPYVFFQESSSGNIVSKIKGIVDGFKWTMEYIYSGFITRNLKLIFNVIALFFVNTNFGLSIMLWCTMFLIITIRATKNSSSLSFKESEVRHSIMGLITDNLTNIFSILYFNARSLKERGLHEYCKLHYIPRQKQRISYETRLSLVSSFMYLGMFSWAIFCLIHQQEIGKINIGTLVFCLSVALSIAEDVFYIGNMANRLASDIGSFNSCLEILNKSEEDESASILKPIKILVPPKITFENVFFSYHDKQKILEDFTLKIDSGQKIGLVGKSGVGKSSVVQLLFKHLVCTSGSVKIDRADVTLFTSESLRENISIVPQEVLLMHTNIMENVRLGRIGASDHDVVEVCKKAFLNDFIMKLPEKYDTMVGERGIKLSGGEKQRIAIARALLKNTPILILDEATSALDIHTEQMIQKSLDSLVSQHNKTMIIITHRLSTLVNVDKIAFLESGRIVEFDTPEQLLKLEKGYYRSFWEKHQGHFMYGTNNT